MDLDNVRTRMVAEKNLKFGVNTHQCICETLRRIYDLIHDLPDKELKGKIVKELVDAMIMSKKMANRLGYYRITYNDKTGKDGESLVALTDTRQLSDFRRSRKYD